MDGDKVVEGVNPAPRDQTDDSLRVERERADAGVAEKRSAAEEEADEVVRTARRLADEVVQDARKEADLEHPPSAIEGANVDRERAQADGLLEDKRSEEDAALQDQRGERSRYLADFLAVEREATDADLIRERDYSDGLVSTRDEFLATVSHDMRNMLGGLGLNAGLLLKHSPEGPGGDRVRRYAAASQRLVARMNRLVNDLLDVVSIDAGKLSMLPESVGLEKILRETLEAFEPVALAKGIALEGVVAAPAWDAQLDGGRVLQVLANLVSNAIKFTSAGGRVSIRVVAERNDIHFSVSDTGIGIPEEAVSAVFERFRQLSKDRQGLGLGLHISKCIVEAHGGRMWAESKVGVGSTFHFALPASPAATVASVETPPGAPVA
jgi:signal transduction histidine kinase